MPHLELDIEQFWKDEEMAHGENCFAQSAPQVALGIRMSNECVYAELGVEGHPWDPIDPVRQAELNKRYNDKAEKIVGRRLLQETFDSPDLCYPQVKRIGEVFGSRYEYVNHTEWLHRCAEEPEDVERMLDRVDRLDIRSFMLPDNWESEKKRIFELTGKKPPLMRHIRGPVTLACSLMGEENFIFLMVDEPDLAKRFSDTIRRVIIEMADVMDEEAGVKPEERGRYGFSFADDNCCLLTPEMYEAFGYPILRDVFARFAPNEGDSRYQHSDSAMGHLLPILGRLGLTGVNFGPTVLVPEIRKYLPKARIDGCLAPFTFMRNEEDNIVAQVRRDCEAAKATGVKGLNLSTAGSINNGSLLTSMRLVMAAIQRYGRY